MSRPISPHDVEPSFAPRRRAEVTSVELDGETILYTGDGALHKLDPIATALWNCFDGSVTLADLVEDLDGIYTDASHERVMTDVLACVRDLGGHGLLDNVAVAEGTALGGDAAS